MIVRDRSWPSFVSLRRVVNADRSHLFNKQTNKKSIRYLTGFDLWKRLLNFGEGVLIKELIDYLFLQGSGSSRTILLSRCRWEAFRSVLLYIWIIVSFRECHRLTAVRIGKIAIQCIELMSFGLIW